MLHLAVIYSSLKLIEVTYYVQNAPLLVQTIIKRQPEDQKITVTDDVTSDLEKTRQKCISFGLAVPFFFNPAGEDYNAIIACWLFLFFTARAEKAAGHH